MSVSLLLFLAYGMTSLAEVGSQRLTGSETNAVRGDIATASVAAEHGWLDAKDDTPVSPRGIGACEDGFLPGAWTAFKNAGGDVVGDMFGVTDADLKHWLWDTPADQAIAALVRSTINVAPGALSAAGDGLVGWGANERDATMHNANVLFVQGPIAMTQQWRSYQTVQIAATTFDMLVMDSVRTARKLGADAWHGRGVLVASWQSGDCVAFGQTVRSGVNNIPETLFIGMDGKDVLTLFVGWKGAKFARGAARHATRHTAIHAADEVTTLAVRGGLERAAHRAAETGARRAASNLATWPRYVHPGAQRASAAAPTTCAAGVCPNPMRGLCFTGGTVVHTPRGLVAIEDIDLGDRVLTIRGAAESDTAAGSTWRRIELEMEDPRSADGKLRIALLRPSTWVEEARARVGALIDFELPETQIRGPARVESIGDAPRIESGAGRVVLTTIASESADVLVLKLRGTNETLEPTWGHRLYSLDRNDWVQAGKLRIGERLRTRIGEAVIAAITQKPGTHTVYNFEVETEHEYLVGKLGVRAHNDRCSGFEPDPPAPTVAVDGLERRFEAYLRPIRRVLERTAPAFDEAVAAVRGSGMHETSALRRAVDEARAADGSEALQPLERWLAHMEAEIAQRSLDVSGAASAGRAPHLDDLMGRAKRAEGLRHYFIEETAAPLRRSASGAYARRLLESADTLLAEALALEQAASAMRARGKAAPRRSARMELEAAEKRNEAKRTQEVAKTMQAADETTLQRAADLESDDVLFWQLAGLNEPYLAHFAESYRSGVAHRPHIDAVRRASQWTGGLNWDGAVEHFGGAPPADFFQRYERVRTPGKCFTAGTLVHMADRGLVAIEDIALGDRVRTTRGAVEDTTAVDSTWRRIELEMEDPRSADGKLRIALLRPSAWVDTVRARIGAMIEVDLQEMQVHGPARVTSIGDAHVEAGVGRVVLMTVESRSSNVLVLEFRNTRETLEPTFGHRLFSLDRDGWVEAGKLRVGERLRALHGEAVIASIAQKPGTHTVYNFEVEREHEYLVGKLGVQSHNDQGCNRASTAFSNGVATPDPPDFRFRKPVLGRDDGWSPGSRTPTGERTIAPLMPGPAFWRFVDEFDFDATAEQWREYAARRIVRDGREIASGKVSVEARYVSAGLAFLRQNEDLKRVLALPASQLHPAAKFTLLEHFFRQMKRSRGRNLSRLLRQSAQNSPFVLHLNPRDWTGINHAKDIDAWRANALRALFPSLYETRASRALRATARIAARISERTAPLMRRLPRFGAHAAALTNRLAQRFRRIENRWPTIDDLGLRAAPAATTADGASPIIH